MLNRDFIYIHSHTAVQRICDKMYVLCDSDIICFLTFIQVYKMAINEVAVASKCIVQLEATSGYPPTCVNV